MRKPLRDLRPSAVVRESVLRATPVAVIFFFLSGSVYHVSPWYYENLSGTVAIAGAISGFLASYVFTIFYYHQEIALGLIGSILSLVLPLAGVLVLLRLLSIPPERAQYWALLPAGLVGELVFEIVKWIHLRRSGPRALG